MSAPRNRNKNLLISGVVGPNGLILNEDAREYFDVIASVNDFKISFKHPFEDPPTVLVFPVWYRDSVHNHPDSIRDIVHAITRLDGKSFDVDYGRFIRDKEFLLSEEKPHVGFNFLVISQEISTDFIRHGYIPDCTYNGVFREPYTILDGNTHKKCPKGYDVPQEMCVRAANRIPTSYHTNRGDLFLQNEPGLPCGCYIWQERDIHYNVDCGTSILKKFKL